MKRASALRDLRARLDAAGIAAAALEARLLVAHALGVAPQTLALEPDRPLAPDEIARLAAFIERRLAGEPVARITGEWEFWGMDFALGPDTLIPRADTETLIETALRELDARNLRQARFRILDLGTGTGCLLAALLKELPHATGIGTDIAPGAVESARGNLARHGLSDRGEVVLADWAEGLDGAFDLVVSNPPYIAHSLMVGLDPEVRGHDPVRALDGGMDGLDFYRRLARDLPRLLLPGGFAVLEIGYDQAQSAPRPFHEAGLIVDAPRMDIAGNPRALIVRMEENRGVAPA